MRRIPTTYNKDGFTHALLERSEFVAIYGKRKGDKVYFETVIIRKHKKDNDFTGTKAGDEYLPCTNEWGSYGWTYLLYGQAKEKMSKIILEKEKKTW